jgi:hypothetical protein
VFSRFEVPIVWAGAAEAGSQHLAMALPIIPVSEHAPPAGPGTPWAPLPAGLEAASVLEASAVLAESVTAVPGGAPGSPAPQPPVPSSQFTALDLPAEPATDERQHSQPERASSAVDQAIAAPFAGVPAIGAPGASPAPVWEPATSAVPDGAGDPPASAPLSAAAEAILRGSAAPPPAHVPDPASVATAPLLTNDSPPREPFDAAAELRVNDLDYHSEEHHMQDGSNDFKIMITGNGLTVERSIDHQTAWAILARLFAPEPVGADGRVPAGSFR